MGCASKQIYLDQIWIKKILENKPKGKRVQSASIQVSQTLLQDGTTV